MIAFRKAHPVLRQKRFLHARERAHDGIEDLFWWRPDGAPMTNGDWEEQEARILCAELRMASGTPAYAEREDAVFLAFNAGLEAVAVTLPDPPAGKRWVHRVDTARPWFGSAVLAGSLKVAGPSVAVCVLEDADD